MIIEISFGLKLLGSGLRKRIITSIGRIIALPIFLTRSNNRVGHMISSASYVEMRNDPASLENKILDKTNEIITDAI